MPITYTVTLDADDDGAFGLDLTPAVLALDWRLGLSAPFDSAAAPSTARVTLRSADAAFSPEAPGSPLRPGLRARISADDGGGARALFTGIIQRVEPQPGALGRRTSLLHLEGPENQLMGARVRLPPQTGQRADQIISAVLDAAPLRRPSLTGYWLLGRGSHSVLGASTRLAALAIARNLQTGRSTFAYAGDTWAGGVRAWDAIRQAADAERGRFFIDRTGTARFLNRHHTLTSAAVASFADDMRALTYAYGEVASVMRITLRPRDVGPPASIVWRLASAQAIPPGPSPRQIVAHFRDSSDRPAGALNVRWPRPGVDYTINTRPDGSGQDVTALVDVWLRAVDFSAATLEFRSAGSTTVYLQAGAVLLGTPVSLGDPITVEQTDPAALALYGPRVVAYDLPLLDDLEHGDNLARFELGRRKRPAGVVRALHTDTVTHPAAVLDLTLFDRIAITEAQTNHSAAYLIIAEEHSVDLGGNRHRVTWLLESAAAGAFWVLDHSRLDLDTALAY